MMKISKLLILLPTIAQAFSFHGPDKNSASLQLKATNDDMMNCDRRSAIGGAFLAGIGCISAAASVRPAFADGLLDEFALPSYGDASKNKSIDLNLETVNSKTMSDAKAKRETKQDEKDRQAYDEMRRLEVAEKAKIIAMEEKAKEEFKQRRAQEKADLVKNRMKTF
mmetsp:Transcript_9326/g.11564  ORF Transcript_9326/g.11564 Transcript_9326/m.11564 type:complete len:167 (+) Transcript_9326:82-582(+)|eukprot:CAMPEP_0194380460 /NCGR_PEP_ID=MMETSP0174-20130528/45239_1 /TAXON_ID=216777 /ORGANISM="Proboscia alata, Strain PI-D3" /LENGTH=166 /DNA_ID=CAMNT_0039163881 /DNA_START=67 /DNA_END=567 /DNA_ORIENTATION=+